MSYKTSSLNPLYFIRQPAVLPASYDKALRHDLCTFSVRFLADDWGSLPGRNRLNEILCLETSKSFQRDACHSYIQLRVWVSASVDQVHVQRAHTTGCSVFEYVLSVITVINNTNSSCKSLSKSIKSPSLGNGKVRYWFKHKSPIVHFLSQMNPYVQ